MSLLQEVASAEERSAQILEAGGMLLRHAGCTLQSGELLYRYNSQPHDRDVERYCVQLVKELDVNEEYL